MRLYIWSGDAQELPDGAGSLPGPRAIRSAATGAMEQDGFGVWCPVNLLDDPSACWDRCLAAARSGGGRLVVRSGRLTAGEDLDELEARFRTQGAEGAARMGRALGPLADRAVAAGVKLCLLPDARDVLSDIPSCLKLLRDQSGRGGPEIELVLDPAGLLTPGMLEAADEHLTRIFESLAGQAGVAALRLTGVCLVERAGGAELEPVGLHRGDESAVDPRLVIGLASRHLREGLDWIILNEDVLAQREVLRMYGPGV